MKTSLRVGAGTYNKAADPGVVNHVDEHIRWSPSADSAMLCPELFPARPRSRLGFFRLATGIG